MLRFILEGLAAGTFVYVSCVEMLSAELGHSHGHNHSGDHGREHDERHIDHAKPPSPFQVCHRIGEFSQLHTLGGDRCSSGNIALDGTNL